MRRCFILQQKEFRIYAAFGVSQTPINDNYCKEITLQEVAAYAGLNPAYLSSLFKKEMEINFSDYITDKRITQAKFLLKNSNATIVDIAGTLGFQGQSYFSNVFKKYTGMTPKQYRYTL